MALIVPVVTGMGKGRDHEPCLSQSLGSIVMITKIAAITMGNDDQGMRSIDGLWR